MLSFLQEQFEILHEIGSGGMGKVYLAKHRKLNRSVALKVLLQNGDSQQRRRFLQEAQTASALNHPNIVVIYDIIQNAGADVIVMEYVAGSTLVDAIPRSGFRVPQTVKYGLQIADALAAAHAAGIVHRDIKPANIMVTDRGHIKILDFGLAKLSAVRSIDEHAETAALSPLTVQGSIVGTMSYMSPEQAQGKPVDARSDVFSFGSVLYEMATGERAFTGDNSISILSSVLRDEPRNIDDIETGSSDELNQVIRRCLRKDPAERWQSMEDVRRALEQLKEPSATSEAIRSASLTSATVQLPRPLVDEQAPKKSRLPMIAAAAGLIAAVAGGGWWFASRTPESSKTALSAPAVQAPAPAAVAKAPLTNDRILEMASARVPEAMIIHEIRTSPGNFDLSAQEVIRLVRGGVTGNTIEAMRNPKGPAVRARTEPAPASTSVKVPDGLPLIVSLREDVPVDAQPQTPLTFTVERDVAVGGTVVIPKGSTARGVVLNRTKRRLLIIGSKVLFQFMDVGTVNGERMKIRATPKPPATDDDAGRPLERGGGKQKNLAAAKGTQMTAYVSGEHQLSLKN